MRRRFLFACLLLAAPLAAASPVETSGWPAGNAVLETAAARLCRALEKSPAGDGAEIRRATGADFGDEGYRVESRGGRQVVQASAPRGALYGAYALAEAVERRTPVPRGVRKPAFPVRQWWSAAFQANFNLPLGGAFDRPIEELSAIVRRTIDEAPRYGVNALQLMGRAGEGGIDVSWFLDYDRFPKLRSRRIGWGVERRIAEVRALADYAHRHGLEFLLWDHELALPPGFTEAYPEVRGTGYPVCFSHPFLREFLSAKFDEFFRKLPEVDGVNLTFAETRGYNVLEHGGCQCDRCARTSTAEKVRGLALDVYQACRRHGKKMQVRSYNQAPRDAEVMRAALAGLPPEIVVFTKNSVVDFRGVRYPDDPLLGAYPGQPQAIEMTACPEGSGYGFLPALLGDFYKEKLSLAAGKRLAGLALRTDYHLQYGHATYFTPGPPLLTFDTPNEFNIAAASRLAWDPGESLDALWSEWSRARYGEQAPRAVAALKRTAEIAGGIFFVKGFSLLTHLNMVPHLDTVDTELAKSYLLEFFPNNAAYRRTHDLLASPSEETIREVLAEKERAAQSAGQGLREASGIAEIESGLRTAGNAARLWREIAAVYFRLRRESRQERREFEDAVGRLLREAYRIERESGAAWPVFPAARGISAYEFAREAQERGGGPLCAEAWELWSGLVDGVRPGAPAYRRRLSVPASPCLGRMTFAGDRIRLEPASGEPRTLVVGVELLGPPLDLAGGAELEIRPNENGSCEVKIRAKS
ncbi:MAG: hypothetical protein HY822_08250 [Acidobacteria bacterium]|nr:hypothetical protein [Acidobacteriota bacterium]